MILFLSGGVRSGKSTLAEKLARDMTDKEIIYVATSVASDTEMQQRIAIHQKNREGRSFRTIEQERELKNVLPFLQKDDVVLLDCLGNLLANELYSSPDKDFDISYIDNISKKILDDIEQLSKKIYALIIVSNEVFSDGIQYGKDSMPFVAALSKLHLSIVAKADTVIECMYGTNLTYKNDTGREI